MYAYSCILAKLKQSSKKCYLDIFSSFFSAFTISPYASHLGLHSFQKSSMYIQCIIIKGGGHGQAGQAMS